MKRIISIIFLFLFISSGLTSGNTEIKSDTDIILIEMFKYANAKNLRSLIKLGEAIKPYNNHTLNVGYSLALYLAAPDIYKQQFVDNFPENYEGIAYDLFDNIEIKRLTPSFLYSFDSLGLIAIEGNIKAIKKIILGATHTDGVIGEIFCDYVVKVLDIQQSQTISTYTELSVEERQGSYKCYDVANADELVPVKEKLKKLRAKVPESEAIVIDEIDKYISLVLSLQKH